MRIWYRVSDLDAARAFYRDVLGFTETFVDEDEGWVSLDRGETEIAIGRAEDVGGDGEGQVATIDVDATILESQKRSALATYDGRTGYQPVVALWAEQDVILADEFRDGNVPRRAPATGGWWRAPWRR